MNFTMDAKRTRDDYYDQMGSKEEENSIDRAMCIPEVAEKIFQFLPFPDLLSCSVVSRVWNINARAALRTRRKCLLSISLEEDFYGNKFLDLIAILEDMIQNPFHGISIIFPRHGPSKLYETAVMIRCWNQLIALLPAKFHCKYLRVHSGSSRKKIETRAIERIISLIHEQLEGIELIGDPPCASGLLSKECWTIMMRNLRELKFDDSESNSKDDIHEWALRMISLAPNLRRINGYFTSDWFNSPVLRDHPVRREFVVTEFDAQVKVARLLHDMDTILKRDLRLVRLRFSYLQARQQHRSPNHRMGIGAMAFRRLEESLRTRILGANSKSLKELTIVHKDLLRISSSHHLPVCPLLTDLTIYVYGEEARDPKFLLNGINFSIYFPLLERVNVIITYGSTDDRVLELDLFNFVAANDHVSHSVKTIHISANISLEGGRSTAAVIFRFAKLFPNVRNFSVDRHKANTPNHFLHALWAVWPYLETITLSLCNLTHLKQSLDALCCGMNDEEVEVLKNGSEADFRNYHIVPVASTLFYKKHLQTLRLQIEHTDVGNRDDPGRSLLSEFAGACALSKLPGLVIQLFVVGSSHLPPECRFNLDHLNPFVNVVSRNCRMRQ